MNVLLLFGGQSPEHEVSVRSAATIYDGLTAAGHQVYLGYITKQGEWLLVPKIIQTTGQPLQYVGDSWQSEGQRLSVDVAFIIVHGNTGEDGQLQRHLESTSTPYVGCSAAVSELCFDKVSTKQTLASAGIQVTSGMVLHRQDTLPTYDDLQSEFGDTLFVKPSRCGSSIGVHKVSTASQLTDALADAFKYDDTLLIEQAVAEPRELEVAVLETAANKLEASDVGEIFLGDSFYSYDDKYASDSQATTTTRADLPEALRQQIKTTAVKTAETLGCRGLVRVDFLYSLATQTLYVNEVNTLPGFTSISMYPQLWAAAGMPVAALCDRLVQTAGLQR